MALLVHDQHGVCHQLCLQQCSEHGYACLAHSCGAARRPCVSVGTCAAQSTWLNPRLFYHKVLHNLANSFSACFPGVPIPTQHAAAGEQIEQAIQTALSEAQQKRITGSEITPYLLDRIQQLTHGASLTANIHLIKNNARVGSQIAVALSQQQ